MSIKIEATLQCKYSEMGNLQLLHLVQFIDSSLKWHWGGAGFFDNVIVPLILYADSIGCAPFL